MDHRRRSITGQQHLVAALMIASAFLVEPVLAGDNPTENAQLAALIRQLDMIDRLAEHSAVLPRQDGSRYYFDYERLHKDIEHVRQGVRDYLVPERAQPRDPVELLGHYRQTSEADQ
jgi:RAQPRD family integrative conjugative element protein